MELYIVFKLLGWFLILAIVVVVLYKDWKWTRISKNKCPKCRRNALSIQIETLLHTEKDVKWLLYSRCDACNAYFKRSDNNQEEEIDEAEFHEAIKKYRYY